jgi:hypothetical protein
VRLFRDALRDRLHQVEDLQHALSHPEVAEPLHELRIAFKRLRYSVEILAESLPKGATPDALTETLATLKAIQEELGTVHDCDVWAATIPAFIAEESERCHAFFGHRRGFARLEPGLHWLERDRAEARAAAIDALRALWGDAWPRTRDWLRDTIDRRPAPPTGSSPEPSTSAAAAPAAPSDASAPDVSSPSAPGTPPGTPSDPPPDRPAEPSGPASSVNGSDPDHAEAVQPPVRVRTAPLLPRSTVGGSLPRKPS